MEYKMNDLKRAFGIKTSNVMENLLRAFPDKFPVSTKSDPSCCDSKYLTRTGSPVRV